MKITTGTNQEKRRRLKSRYVVLLLVILFVVGFFVGKTYSASQSEQTAVLSERDEIPTPDAATPNHIELDEEGSVEQVPIEEELDQEEAVVEEEPAGKVVYLTFDDGPSEWTGELLDVLDAHNISATFFMQGVNLQKEHLQQDVKRAVEEGSYVGGHSMTHDYKTLYTQQQFVPEMEETLTLIHEITKTSPHLVRPPYGSAPGLENKPIRDQLAASGIKIWDWTIDSCDWQLRGNPSQIIENVKRETRRDREVVLMHEKPQTVAALPEIITFYKEQGYTFAVYNDAHHFVLNFQNDDTL